MKNEDDDFGFTIEHEETVPEVYQKTVYVDNKAKEIYDLVAPFFIKLRDGVGDTIKWPQEKRYSEISKLLTKLREIVARQDEKNEAMVKMTKEEIEFKKAMGVL